MMKMMRTSQFLDEGVGRRKRGILTTWILSTWMIERIKQLLATPLLSVLAVALRKMIVQVKAISVF